MKNIRFIIGGIMGLINGLNGIAFLLQGRPSDTQQIMGLLWLIFALI